jgi:hypothetical protein
MIVATGKDVELVNRPTGDEFKAVRDFLAGQRFECYGCAYQKECREVDEPLIVHRCTGCDEEFGYFEAQGFRVELISNEFYAATLFPKCMCVTDRAGESPEGRTLYCHTCEDAMTRDD